MSDIPDQLTLKVNRDREGKRDVLVRRAALAVLLAFLALGLVNVFGQRPSTSTVSPEPASLEVYAPERVRAGLFYEARFTVEARRELEDATVVLDPGWAEGITINTTAPSPLGEASRDGDIVYELGRIPSGAKHVLFLQLQVNPTNVGHRSQDVRLYDGDELLATIHRTITIFP